MCLSTSLKRGDAITRNNKVCLKPWYFIYFETYNKINTLYSLSICYCPLYQSIKSFEHLQSLIIHHEESLGSLKICLVPAMHITKPICNVMSQASSLVLRQDHTRISLSFQSSLVLTKNVHFCLKFRQSFSPFSSSPDFLILPSLCK